MLGFISTFIYVASFPYFFLKAYFFFRVRLPNTSRPTCGWVQILELAVAAGNSQTLGDSRRRLNFSRRSRRRWAGECGSLRLPRVLLRPFVHVKVT